jgi:hypothetical protein
MMDPTRYIVEGADVLRRGPRRVLNLWNEAEMCHLGHLHLLLTARELVALDHTVTFYVGEFRSPYFALSEYRRREESYDVMCHFLRAFVKNAAAVYGEGAEESGLFCQLGAA